MKLLSRAMMRRASLAAALSAAVLATGCSQSAPGVVAYVGNEEISQSELETAVAAVTTTVEPGQTVSSAAVINALIQGELAAQIATQQKITITDAQRDAFLKTSNLASLLNVPAAKPLAYDVADTQIVSQKLGDAAYVAAIGKAEVKLNPRYGVLDPAQKTVVADQSGSLSVPGPAAATP